jgi:hypothetical protein
MKPHDWKIMKKLVYVDDDDKIHFAGEETTPELKDDKIVIFKSFFRAWLQLPTMSRMIAEVLNKYEIYMHQLMSNAIV